MKNILVFVITLQVLLIKAQIPNFTWANKMGSSTSDIGNAIAVDASGNIYTTGFFTGTADFDPGISTVNLTSAGANDIFISKLNSSGNFVWALQVGGIGNDVGNAITTDAPGNIYVSGYFTSTVDLDPGAGTNTVTSFGGFDIFILKLDGATGNLSWAKQMGGSANDEAKSITVDATGNVHTTGSFSTNADLNPGAGVNNLISAGGFDVFVSKLDASGNFVWAKGMGGPNNDIGNSIAVDASGNVCTTGFFSTTSEFDPGPSTFSLSSLGAGDVFVSKLDVSGNFVWAKQLGGTANDVGNGLAIDASGNIYSGGYFFNGGDFDPGPSTFSLVSEGVGDIYVSKLDGSGNFLWAKGMGGPKDDFAHALTIDGSGNVYTTGFFADTADFDPGVGTNTLISVFPMNPLLVRDQTFVSKLDASGNYVWAGALGSIKGYGIAASTNVIYTTGFFTSTTDFDPSSAVYNLTTFGSDDIFVHKMDQVASGINETDRESFFKVFPNPSSGNYTISATSVIERIIVTDVLGNEVIREASNNKMISLDLGTNANGVYFVKILAGNTEQVHKLVLNK